MLLYHGSNTEVSNPQILESNRRLDFVRDFTLPPVMNRQNVGLKKQ